MLQTTRKARKGSVLVEYGLLVAGIVLTSVLALAVLGHKTGHVFGVMAGIMPAAHADDGKPIQHTQTIPLDTLSSDRIMLNTAGMVSPAGVDRMSELLGAGGGELLIVD